MHRFLSLVPKPVGYISPMLLNIFVYRLLIYNAEPDMVEGDTAESREVISRQQNNKPPHCQWHCPMWHRNGANQGVCAFDPISPSILHSSLFNSLIILTPIPPLTGLDPTLAEHPVFLSHSSSKVERENVGKGAFAWFGSLHHVKSWYTNIKEEEDVKHNMIDGNNNVPVEEYPNVKIFPYHTCWISIKYLLFLSKQIEVRTLTLIANQKNRKTHEISALESGKYETWKKEDNEKAYSENFLWIGNFVSLLVTTGFPMCRA